MTAGRDTCCAAVAVGMSEVLRRRPRVHLDLGRVPISPDRQLRLEQHVPFVRDRLKRAGIRLGHLLNMTLGQEVAEERSS